MYRVLVLWLCLLVGVSGTALAAKADTAAGKGSEAKEPSAKQLSGMSIVGNDEAPKALYIVPWKGSEIGVDTSLNRMLTESDEPVDRDVFMRQLDFFEVSTKK